MSLTAEDIARIDAMSLALWDHVATELKLAGKELIEEAGIVRGVYRCGQLVDVSDLRRSAMRVVVAIRVYDAMIASGKVEVSLGEWRAAIAAALQTVRAGGAS